MVSGKQMHFGYSRREVFNNLDLELLEAHLRTSSENNGAGKSTLLRVLLCVTVSCERNCQMLESYAFITYTLHSSAGVHSIPLKNLLPNVKIRSLIQSSQPDFTPRFNWRSVWNSYLQAIEHPGWNSICTQMSSGQKKKVVISLGLASNTQYSWWRSQRTVLTSLARARLGKIISGNTAWRTVHPSSARIRWETSKNLIDRIMIIDTAKLLFDERIGRHRKKHFVSVHCRRSRTSWCTLFWEYHQRKCFCDPKSKRTSNKSGSRNAVQNRWWLILLEIHSIFKSSTPTVWMRCSA